MIESIKRFNTNNESIMKFRKRFAEYTPENSYYIRINGEFSYVTPTSETSCSVLKPNGESSIFDEYTIDDINDSKYTFTDTDGSIVYSLVFDIKTIDEVIKKCGSLFVLSEHISQKPTIYHIDNYSEKEIIFTSSKGEKYALTTEYIMERIIGIFDAAKRRYAQYEANNKYLDIYGYNESFNTLLNPMIPVKMISRSDIIEEKNDLISKDCIRWKQVYRYNNDLYKLYDVTIDSVVFHSIFYSLYSTEIKVTHDEATKFEPISGDISATKKLELCNVPVFKKYDKPVIIERTDYNTIYMIHISNCMTIHDNDIGDTSPKDVKNIYKIESDKNISIPDDIDYIRKIINIIRESHKIMDLFR